MKLSELKQLIKEEITAILTEESNISSYSEYVAYDPEMEEAAKRHAEGWDYTAPEWKRPAEQGFIAGAQWMRNKMKTTNQGTGGHQGGPALPDWRDTGEMGG